MLIIISLFILFCNFVISSDCWFGFMDLLQYYFYLYKLFFVGLGINSIRCLLFSISYCITTLLHLIITLIFLPNSFCTRLQRPGHIIFFNVYKVVTICEICEMVTEYLSHTISLMYFFILRYKPINIEVSYKLRNIWYKKFYSLI